MRLVCGERWEPADRMSVVNSLWRRFQAASAVPSWVIILSLANSPDCWNGAGVAEQSSRPFRSESVKGFRCPRADLWDLPRTPGCAGVPN